MKVPVIGKSKKWVVYGVGGVAVAYVGWRWWSASREEEPEPGADGLYTTPDLSEYGLSTTGGATTVTGNTGSQTTDATGADTIDTNAEWSQKAVELLGNAGYDSAVVYAALGEFLSRRSLDQAEATIARAALAAAGQPPVNGPFSVIEEATTGGTGTPGSPKNLKSGGAATSTTVVLTWDRVDGAAGYRIYRGTGENVGHSTDNKFTVTGLQPDTTYSFTVAALSSTGKTGPRSNTYKGKTTGVKLTKPSTPKASAVKATSFRAATGSVKGATVYEWFVGGVPKGKTERPYRDFTGATPNTTYKIQVRADTVGGSPGPLSGVLTLTTKRK